MRTVITLDEKDIQKAIAKAYDVQPDAVRIEHFMQAVGYGAGETYIPAIKASVEVDKAVRM